MQQNLYFPIIVLVESSRGHKATHSVMGGFFMQGNAILPDRADLTGGKGSVTPITYAHEFGALSAEGESARNPIFVRILL